MSEHPQDELLHGALDGTLTEAQAGRLRDNLAADPPLRERAAGLRRVKDMVDGIGLEEPPAGFAERVMAAVAEGAAERPTWIRRCVDLVKAGRRQLFGPRVRHFEQDSDSGDMLRWTTGMAGGGANVAKKTLWVVAGFAVAVILGVVYYNGTRSVDQGAEGTIGAADRYRGAQPASVAAKEGNAQKFLQSDTFDRLLKDKNVRALMADKEMCALLAKPEVAAAMNKAQVQSAMRDETLDAALKNANLMVAMQDETMDAALKNANLMVAMQDETMAAALRSANLTAALKDAKVQALLTDKKVLALLGDADAVQAALNGKKPVALAESAEFDAALKNDKFRKMVSDAGIQAALKKGNSFAALLGDETFAAALRSNGSARFLSAISDAGIQAAMKNPNFRALMADETFAVALRGDPDFARLFSDVGIQAALRQGQMMQLIGGGDPDFQAALRDSEAMDAALRRVK